MVNNGWMSVSSPPLLDLKDVAVQALLSSVIMSQKQLQKICGFLWLELFKSSYVIYQLFICKCTHVLGKNITKPERFLGWAWNVAIWNTGNVQSKFLHKSLHICIHIFHIYDIYTYSHSPSSLLRPSWHAPCWMNHGFPRRTSQVNWPSRSFASQQLQCMGCQFPWLSVMGIQP